MIRKITPADKELFLRLAAEFYASDAVLEPVPEAYHLAAFEELMRSEAYLDCYILECDGAAAGYALLSITYSQEAGGKVIWLEELFILEPYRGKGLGREFLSYMEENIPAKKYRLEVEKGNTRAIALYEQVGYSVFPYVQLIKNAPNC